MRIVLLLSVAMLVPSCPPPSPPPVPDVGPPSPPRPVLAQPDASVCTGRWGCACAQLKTLGCREGNETAMRHQCEEVFSTAESHGSKFDVDCVMRSTTVAEVRRCGFNCANQP